MYVFFPSNFWKGDWRRQRTGKNYLGLVSVLSAVYFKDEGFLLVCSWSVDANKRTLIWQLNAVCRDCSLKLLWWAKFDKQHVRIRGMLVFFAWKTASHAQFGLGWFIVTVITFFVVQSLLYIHTLCLSVPEEGNMTSLRFGVSFIFCQMTSIAFRVCALELIKYFQIIEPIFFSYLSTP
jgi:hypothetical protein